MSTKLTKWVTIGFFGLLIIWGLIDVLARYFSKSDEWTTDDKVLITQTCLDDLGGRAVRFPNESEAYCSCYTQEITTHYTKSKYQYLEQLSQAEQEKEMLSVILDCVNTYQKAIFDGSRLDDNLQP